jgi:DNA-binding transcriptional MocR family regulator
VDRTIAPTELRALLSGSPDTAAQPSAGVLGFRALAGEVSQLIAQARLPLGARMPAERELALALGLSRTTVSAAYELLRAHGYLRSRRGAGSWITVPLPGARYAQPQLTDALDAPDIIDLAIAAPSAAGGEIAAAMAVAADVLPRYLGGSGYATFGLTVLREAIADHHTRRGLPTSPDQILVTAGAQQGIDLVVTTLTAPGDRVIVDSPTYPGALDSVVAARARAVPVDLCTDDAGHRWDVGSYTASVRQTAPALAYLIADYHNPTGSFLDDDGRSRIVAACRQSSTPLVVDETLADLALDSGGADVLPVAAHDASGGVITLGSLSKSIWGGLRIGWIRADPQLVHRFALARARTDMAGPVLEQLIATELLRDHGSLAASRQAALRQQRDALVAALSDAVPQWRIRMPAGGLSLWVELDAPDSSVLAAQAGGFGLRLASGRRFGSDVRLERWLRVPFSQPPDTLVEAARRLGLLTERGSASITPHRVGVELIA